MKHLAFVESNTTGTGELAVERLLAAGQRVTFLTRTPEKYRFLASARPGLTVVALDTNDTAQVVACAERLRTTQGLDGLTTFSEFYVPAAAEAAARCGLPGLDPGAARTCRDKPATRRALRAAGLPTPDFHLLRSADEAREVALRVAYPCVMKPPADSSSHGVRLVHDRAEFLAHHAALAKVTHNVRGQRLDGSVLVESLLDGPEYSVETFTRPGGATQVVGVTDKHLSPPPLFVEVGHDFPSAGGARRGAALARAALDALRAVGFDFGPAHTELRFTSRGPVVVEINPRLAGGMIPELIAHATGLDLMQAWFDAALGEPVRLTPRRSDTASIRFVLAPAAGTLAGVLGQAAARALPYVREVCITRAAGAPVRPARDAYDRLGYVIAAGPERERVARGIDAALGLLRVQVEPPREAVPA